jgi:hypothetical protein
MRAKLFALVFVGLFTAIPSVSAQSEKVLALGEYDFHHYYDYEELTRYLRDINEAFPNLTELSTLVTSEMGRDVWLLTINNPETGKAENKPGIYINQIHAGEVIAAMSNLYTIWYLLDNYGKNDYVTSIVDRNVWYFIPRLDVDGADAYLKQAPAGEDPDPTDSDGDFLFDEDPAEDIDGDGLIVQMRQEDPLGEWRLSEVDPRILIRRSPDDMDGTFYTLYSEGIDNDDDGRINEDPFATGFVSNRNYPFNWKTEAEQGGGKSFPMQEDVIYAEVSFLYAHPNVAVYIQSHCCGRVILRPPTTAVDAEFPFTQDLELYQIAAARALDLSGWNLATSVYEWNWPRGVPNTKRNQVYRGRDGNLENLPDVLQPEESLEDEPGSDRAAGFYSATGENEYLGDRGYYAWGSSLETAYNMYGIFAFADEHWAQPDYDKDGEISDLERLKWNDEEMGGAAFVDWHAFDHPTLGPVEIGGFVRHKMSPPEGARIQEECEMGNAYKIYLADLTPRLGIKSEVEDKGEGVYEVTLAVENKGFLPTALQQAQGVGITPKLALVLQVEPDDNLEVLFGDEKVALAHLEGNSESEDLTYIVRKRDLAAEASLSVTVAAPRAGQASSEIAIR